MMNDNVCRLAGIAGFGMIYNQKLIFDRRLQQFAELIAAEVAAKVSNPDEVALIMEMFRVETKSV